MNWNRIAERIAEMTPEQRERDAEVYNFNPSFGEETYLKVTNLTVDDDRPAIEIGGIEEETDDKS
jgi:hypothetical protein